MTLGKKLANQGHTVYFVTNISLKDRVKVINELKPDLVISIHHDSVQEKYLSKWIYNGKEYSYCDKFSGYSIFVSKKNKDFTNSFRFAKLVGENLLKSGLYPTYHHNEPIEGENKEFLNKDLGVYRYDNLVVLQTNIPSILLECGIIINRSDELVLRTDYMINTITDSVVKAIRVYFNNHSL
jgi:N-acetylmuramoyl-L-alanine amidase